MGSSGDGSSSASKSFSFVEGFKTEWSFFWQSIVGDHGDESGETVKDPFLSGKIETLNLDKIKAITKALSEDRKKLNQRLESLKKELDLNSAKLESLRLVGGEIGEAESGINDKINNLSDLGEMISNQLGRIDERLKIARSREKELYEESEF